MAGYNLILLIIFFGACHVAWTVIDTPMTARVGQPIVLPCRVPYNTNENLVRWFMGSNQLSVGQTMLHNTQRLKIENPVPNEYNLVIKSVVKSDEEVYSCNSLSHHFSRIHLQVQWRPEFNDALCSPYQVTMTEGTTDQLRCTAEGMPKPVITWYRRPQRARSLFKEIGVTGDTLTLHDVTRYVNDVFMCNASNLQGYVTKEMNVTVHFPPEVLIYEEDQYVQSSEQVLVTCLVQGSPLLDFYWKFETERIETNWKYVVHVEHEEGYPVLLLTLMVRKGILNSYDFGIYTCHADGEGKEAVARIHIIQEATKTTL